MSDHSRRITPRVSARTGLPLRTDSLRAVTESQCPGKPAYLRRVLKCIADLLGTGLRSRLHQCDGIVRGSFDPVPDGLAGTISWHVRLASNLHRRIRTDARMLGCTA